MRIALLAALLCGLAVAASAQEGEPPPASRGRPAPSRGFVLVVNEANPVSELRREEVERIFMRKIKRWSDWDERLRIEPVDHKDITPVRERFSRLVHKKPARHVVEYWRRLIFSGRELGPEALDSDAEVLAFVAANRGAIGYVSTAARLVPGVKVVRLRLDGD